VRGAYPGTFDPPTIAHLAIAEAAVRQLGLERVDLIVNEAPLGKATTRNLVERIAMLEAVAASRPWLGVAVTDELHIAAIARGYDVLVVGADKWHQMLDVSFYESEAARDAVLAHLPRLAVAPREGLPLPEGCVVLDIDMPDVSSTAARRGEIHLVVAEARPFVD
jgi:nicotinic acid mononucleotide adenylyltransferase